jgi:hypothetical protein
MPDLNCRKIGTAAYYHPAQKKSCIRAKQSLSNTR